MKTLNTPSAPCQDVDPITVEVIGSALSTIAEEMGKTVIRAAFSANIKERHDCSAALFDTKGQTLALAEQIPFHLGSLLGIADYVLAHNDLATLQEGDIFIGNDAYHGGGTHLNDFVLMAPVFFNGSIVGWVAILAHHADFVDRGHQHIFQEGLRIPPVRLYRAGSMQEDLLQLILLNCQVPRERINDLRAQTASCRLGVRRLQALYEKYGVATMTRASKALLDYTERRTRAGIAAIPDGVYHFQHPFDTTLLEETLDLQVHIRVEKEDIFFSFPDAPAAVPAPVNMVYTALLATVYFAMKVLVDPDILPNSGFHRPVHVSAPAGSILNARAPAPVYSRTDLSPRLVDMIFAAFAPIIPHRIAAASTGGMLLTTSGIHPRTGEFYVYNEMHGGGMGARAKKDGLDGVQVNITNTANLPIEALESEYPVRVECYKLVRDSGGAGEFRGGMTLYRRVRMLNHQATICAGSTGHRVPPFGLFGGLAGSLARAELSDGAQPLCGRNGILEADQTIAIVPAAGGGYGNPRHRDRESVRRDFIEDRISKQAAITLYGLDANDAVFAQK